MQWSNLMSFIDRAADLGSHLSFLILTLNLGLTLSRTWLNFSVDKLTTTATVIKMHMIPNLLIDLLGIVSKTHQFLVCAYIGFVSSVIFEFISRSSDVTSA